MKIRQSFVTNSSSTSYTLVIKDEAPKGFFSIFDLLSLVFNRSELEAIDEYGALYFQKTKAQQYDDRDFKILDLNEYILNAKSGIEWKAECIEDEKKQVEKYTDLLTKDEDIISCFASEYDIKQGMSRLDSAKKHIEISLNLHKRHLNEYIKELEFDKKQLEVLSEFEGKDNKDLRLLFIDVNDWDRIGIDKLIEKSNAIVLKKERT